MEPGLPYGTLISGNVNNSSDFNQFKSQCSPDAPADNSIDDLTNALDKVLGMEKLEDNTDADKSSNKGDKLSELAIDDHGCRQKFLCGSVTFPDPGTVFPNTSTDEKRTHLVSPRISKCSCQLKDIGSTCSCSVTSSTPPPPKLVSALKGSREKEGRTSGKKLSVRWAADVYDPPPSSVSHAVHGKRRQKADGSGRRSGKRYWKKQQAKGSGHKGGKEKQRRSRTGASGSCPRWYKALDLHGGAVDLDCPGESLDVGGGAGSNCGSSFLKKSVANLHMSFAEAL